MTRNRTFAEWLLYLLEKKEQLERIRSLLKEILTVRHHGVGGRDWVGYKGNILPWTVDHREELLTLLEENSDD